MEKLKPLKIKIFNVGHGDCILLEFPNGELGLIDSQIPRGLKSCPAIELIEKKKHLKFLCLTHPHSDHFRGMLQILENSQIKIDVTNQF